jgi:catechol 2,3-dioxygenase-like lactoylglutathione lyase family enzyme
VKQTSFTRREKFMMQCAFIERTVPNYDDAKAWYTKFLGQPPSFERRAKQMGDSDFCLFDLGGIQLALKEWESHAPGDLFYFRLPDLPSFHANITRLAALDIHPIGTPKVSEEGYTRLLYRDPSDYDVGVFVMPVESAPEFFEG